MKHIWVYTVIAILIFSSCKGKIKEATSVSSTYPTVDIAANSTINPPQMITIKPSAWKAFEGELGRVILYNNTNEAIAESFITSKDGDWMQNPQATFIANLDFQNDQVQDGRLVFHNNFVTEEGGGKRDSFSIPVKIGVSKPAAATINADGSETYCFASKAKSPMEGNFHNYHFIRLTVSKDNTVKGYQISAPYGTDGSRGHMTGSMDKSTGKLTITESSYGEGEIAKIQSTYVIKNGKLGLGFLDENKKEVTLAQVNCPTFDKWMNDYDSEMVSPVNSNDRSRLSGIKTARKYTDAEFNQLSFLEKEIELDNNYDTKEYIVYLNGGNDCDANGCDLYVIDEKGKILSITTKVGLPIFTDQALASNQPKNVKWNDLIVFSDGAYRRINYSSKGYISEANKAPKIAEQSPEMHPELFRKVN